MIIFKYPLSTQIRMPEGAQILCVKMQNGSPHLWALVNPDRSTKLRDFIILGTGHEYDFPTVSRHIGTYFEDGGKLVWHVFEVG